MKNHPKMDDFKGIFWSYALHRNYRMVKIIRLCFISWTEYCFAKYLQRPYRRKVLAYDIYANMRIYIIWWLRVSIFPFLFLNHNHHDTFVICSHYNYKQFDSCFNSTMLTILSSAMISFDYPMSQDVRL